MAAIKAVVTDVSEMGDGATLRVVWTPVTEADECVPVRLPWLADRTIQALGTFGSCNVAVHGSNDGGVTYAALNDPTGTVIDITAAGSGTVRINEGIIEMLPSIAEACDETPTDIIVMSALSYSANRISFEIRSRNRFGST